MTEPIPSGNVRTCESRSLMAARVERGSLDGVVLLLVRCETPLRPPNERTAGAAFPAFWFATRSIRDVITQALSMAGGRAQLGQPSRTRGSLPFLPAIDG